MKNTTKLAAFVAALIMLLALAGCAKAPAAPAAPAESAAPVEPAAPAASIEPVESAAPVTPAAPAEPAEEGIVITDMMGREVKLAAPAKKVIVLSAGECEIVYALGAGELVIGRGTYCDYPAEVFDVGEIKSGGELNIEEIAALEPDVVITSAMDLDPAAVEKLEAAGIPVLESYERGIDGVYESIANIGKALGKSDEAAALTQEMESAFSQIEANKLDGTKTVYFEVSPLQWGLWTAGSNTFMDEVANMLGLKNCFADVEGWAAISEEQVLERNPDYIVTISMYYGEGPTPVEEIKQRAGWGNINAVANDAILNLDNNQLSRPAPRLVEGAQMLADFAAAH